MVNLHKQLSTDEHFLIRGSFSEKHLWSSWAKKVLSVKKEVGIKVESGKEPCGKQLLTGNHSVRQGTDEIASRSVSSSCM